MCTAVTYKTVDFYFGRNLDYEFSYGEDIVIMPRNFDLLLSQKNPAANHYAVIGTAHVRDGFPLYYDAANEKGLCAAGLNFVGNAVYKKASGKPDDIAQYEFIPWLLGHCSDIKEAREALSRITLTDTPFAADMPTASLHWLIADKNDCIVYETTADGAHIYDNPTGVLTNNPPFPMQLFALNNYRTVSAEPVPNFFSSDIALDSYSRGLGTNGLPGGLSSQSRFVRAAFVRANSCLPDNEYECIGQFFHILGSVEQQKGCCRLKNGKSEFTIYSCCINADKGIYYYTTYQNNQITAIDMYKENLNGSALISYPLIFKQNIFYPQNTNS